jgi:hypothetical protein
MEAHGIGFAEASFVKRGRGTIAVGWEDYSFWVSSGSSGASPPAVRKFRERSAAFPEDLAGVRWKMQRGPVDPVLLSDRLPPTSGTYDSYGKFGRLALVEIPLG